MSIKSALRFAFVLALVAGIFLSLASYATSMAVGLWTFFVDQKGIEAGTRLLNGIPVYFFLFLVWEIPYPLRMNLAFAALLIIYAATFAGAFFVGKRFDWAVRDSFNRPLIGSFRNWLFAMPVVSSMLLMAIIALTLFQESQGVPTGTLENSDPYLTFFSVSYAPIAEELGFRIIPLGAFMILHASFFNRERFTGMSSTQILRTLIFAFLLPDRFRGNLGLNTIGRVGFRKSIRASDWIIILLTAFSFGFAHFIAGGGWGIGKISQTFLAGMVLGPLFLLYGAPAPILTHWMFNFYLSSYEMAPESWFLIPLVSIIIAGATGWIGAFGQAMRITWSRLRGPAPSTSTVAAPALFCPQCGSPFVGADSFCGECGAPRPIAEVRR